jgi:Smg protein
MAIDSHQVTLEKVQWISLIVLLNQPDEELAIAHMENIIYQEESDFLN